MAFGFCFSLSNRGSAGRSPCWRRSSGGCKMMRRRGLRRTHALQVAAARAQTRGSQWAAWSSHQGHLNHISYSQEATNQPPQLRIQTPPCFPQPRPPCLAPTLIKIQPITEWMPLCCEPDQRKLPKVSCFNRLSKSVI